MTARLEPNPNQIAHLRQGSGHLIALGLVLAVFGAWQFSRFDDQLGLLTTASDHTSRTDKMTLLAERLRRAALYYKDTGDDPTVTEFNAAEDQIAKLLKEATGDAESAARRDAYGSLLRQAETLRHNFDGLVQLGNKIKDGRKFAVQTGADLATTVGKMIEAGRASDDAAVLSDARDVQGAFLAVRALAPLVSVYKTRHHSPPCMAVSTAPTKYWRRPLNATRRVISAPRSPP